MIFLKVIFGGEGMGLAVLAPGTPACVLAHPFLLVGVLEGWVLLVFLFFSLPQ